MPTKPVLLDSTGQSILSALEAKTPILEAIAQANPIGKTKGIAGDFSTSVDYAAGDYVFKDGTLYRFTAAHAAGAWSGTDATAAVATGDMITLRDTIDDTTAIAYGGTMSLTAADFEQGSWSYSKKSDSTKRIRCKRLIQVSKGSVLTVLHPTLDLYVGRLASPYGTTYAQASNWQTASNTPYTYTATGDGYLAIILRGGNESGADITVTDFDCTIGISSANNENGCLWRGRLDDNTDLDDVDDNGVYSGSYSRTYANRPPDTSGHSFVLWVVRLLPDAYAMQVYMDWSSGYMYTRSKPSASTWSDWTSYEKNIEADVASKFGKTLAVKGTMVADTDLDDIDTTGVYLGATGRNYANIPSGENGACVLEVIHSTATENVLQLYRGWYNDRTYVRSRSSGTWSAWSQDTAVFRNYGRISDNTDLDDIRKNGFYTGNAANTYPHAPESSTSFILQVVQSVTNYAEQIYSNWFTGLTYRRTYVATDEPYWTAWASYEKDTRDELDDIGSLKILFIGNSYTADSIGYMPYVLKNIAPSISPTIGYLHIGSSDFGDWLDAWTNETSVLYYKKTPSTNWATGAYKKMRAVLHEETWDVVVIQNSATKDPTYASGWADGITLLDDIVGYVSADDTGYTGHQIKAGYLAPQIRIEEGGATGTFEDVMAMVQQFMEDSACSFMIPCTTAIENARGTALDSYGKVGHLNYDYTGHMHEGIGPLCSSYCVALRILELMCKEKAGILGEKTRPTVDWILTRNVPQRNWGDEEQGTETVVGISDANCLLAQKCAVAAIKYPYQVSTIV